MSHEQTLSSTSGDLSLLRSNFLKFQPLVTSVTNKAKTTLHCFLYDSPHQLHIVDEGVAVLPGLHSVAAQGLRCNHLQNSKLKGK
jgi:hypothetical protein